MGYIAILKYFDAVVVSMVMLLEPISAYAFAYCVLCLDLILTGLSVYTVATFIGLAVGVDTLPGWVTWVSPECNNKLSALLPVVLSRSMLHK